jgi:hypothetical protein
MGARPCFVIGSTDYISYIQMDGIKWECNDLDSEESGRTLDGVMHRARVAQKRKITVSLNPLKTEDFSAISAAIAGEYVDVKILDPKEGDQVTFTFYGSAIKSATMADDGVDCYWSGGQFSLIER